MAAIQEPRHWTIHAHHLAKSALAFKLAAEAEKVRATKAEGLPLSEYLWNGTSTYQMDALNSKFIQGIKGVSLDPTGFGAYMVQDSVFCYNAKENIDEAAKRADDIDIKKFLEARSESFLKYYKYLFNVWHIVDASGITLGKACADYVHHEHDVATSMKSLYFIVALIPCARLWPWLGNQIGADTGSFGVYGKWVKTNLNPEDDGFRKYEILINNAEIAGYISRDTALEVYSKSMKGEADFFSSVHENLK